MTFAFWVFTQLSYYIIIYDKWAIQTVLSLYSILYSTNNPG